MAKGKDTKGRNLKENEDQMPDGRYRYRYTDKNGNRKAVYSWKLKATDKVPQGKKDGLSLRQKEKEIEKDLQDGIDSSLASNTTLNDMFDKYISLKTNLKENTRINYIYNYDHFIRDEIGNRKIKSFRYSDIKAFYNGLLNKGVKINTLDNVHVILHPTFRHFSAHNLRHTFCTRLCEVENNLKLIMSIMGHKDIQTTMNIYNEIQEAKKKEAFEELNQKIKIS